MKHKKEKHQYIIHDMYKDLKKDHRNNIEVYVLALHVADTSSTPGNAHNSSSISSHDV